MILGHPTFAAGTNIANGTPITKTIYKDTNHTYTFTTNKDGEVYITVDKTTGGLYVKLLDSYGNTVDYDYSYSGGTSFVLSANVAKGTYSIEVSPFSWSGISSASYRIKATYASTFTRNATTYETNDTKETSMNLTNGQLYSSTAETSSDRDVYKFTTAKDGEVYITLDQAKAGFYITLKDSYGTTQKYDYFYSAGGTAVLKGNLVKGTYYVYVDPFSWSGITSASYRLKATYASTFTRNASTFETNDTAETSLPMISNTSYSSSSYSALDRDVYQLTTNKDGNVTINLDKNTAGYYMSLLDSYGNSVGYDYTYSAGDSLSINTNLQQGTYYLYIDPFSWNGTTSATYRVKASFIDKTPSVDPIYDTGTVLTGTAVSGTKVYASVGSVKLGETTAKSGKYSITIPAQKAGTIIGVYTVDSIGNTSTTRRTTVVNSTIKAVSASYNKIKVSWYSVPGASGYEVYRSTSSTGTYSRVGTVTSGSTVSYTNSDVTTGTNYYYKVRAYRVINGTKVYSPFTKYTSGKAIPSTPTNWSAIRVSSTSIKLSWSSVEGASGYEIYRATSSTGTYGLLKTTTSLSYTNSGLTTGQTYYYKLRAYRTVGSTKVYSGWTTIISARP